MGDYNFRVIYYIYERSWIEMKTIQDVLDKYPDEMFINGSKARIVSQIVATIGIREQAKRNFEEMLELTTQLEGRD
jgi:hypothetical protein